MRDDILLRVETSIMVFADRKDLPVNLIRLFDGLGEPDARSATSAVYFHDTIVEQLESLEEDGNGDTAVVKMLRRILDLSEANSDADFTIYY